MYPHFEGKTDQFRLKRKLSAILSFVTVSQTCSLALSLSETTVIQSKIMSVFHDPIHLSKIMYDR
jgi:hypothetical protein